MVQRAVLIPDGVIKPARACHTIRAHRELLKKVPWFATQQLTGASVLYGKYM